MRLYPLLIPADNGTLYTGKFTGFPQPGLYRIIVQAEDNASLVARPVEVAVRVGSQVFLPVVMH